MSTAAMVFILGTIIYFVSRAPLKPILITIPIFLVLAVLVILSSPYRLARLKAMISGEDGSESSYHVKQALVALGSGGVSGVGFGQSKQKYQYLPEVASDSIFAIIGEEFGFIGTVLYIAMIICVIADIMFLFQNENKNLWYVAIFAILYLLIASLGESSFFSQYSLGYGFVIGLSLSSGLDRMT